MRAVMVIYLVIVMFMATIESEGYHGVEYSDVNVSELGTISEKYQNVSGALEPIRASTGFLNIFLSIVVKSLTFKYEIIGAPSEVNFLIKMFLFILAWLAFYDIVVILMTAALSVIKNVI